MKKFFVGLFIGVIIVIWAFNQPETVSKADTQTVKITVVPHIIDANYIVSVGHSVTIFSDANCSIVYNAKKAAAKETVPVYTKIKNRFWNVNVTVK